MRDAIAAVRYEGSEPKDIAVLTFEYSKEDGVWVSECLELGTVAQASTLEEAREELVQAVRLQLNEMEELGFIEPFLRDHSVKTLPILRSHGTSSHGTSWEPQLVGA